MTVRAVTLPDASVTTPLQELYITNTALDIPARTVGAFTTDCDVGSAYRSTAREAMAFNIYYVLPHFHEIATAFKLELSGGTRDGDVVFDTGGASAIRSRHDDRALQRHRRRGLPPHLHLRQRVGRARAVRLDREDEMCVLLAYTDAPVKVLGQSTGASVAGTPDVDGTVPFDVGCMGLAVSPMND